MSEVFILSREEASKWKFERPYIHISIADPEQGPVADNSDPNKIDRLDLVFHDAQPHDGGDWVFMNAEQANLLLDFVEKHPGLDIVVNCWAGISRSAGIAKALCRILGLRDDHCYIPPRNPSPHVYKTIMRAYFVRKGKIDGTTAPSDG